MFGFGDQGLGLRFFRISGFGFRVYNGCYDLGIRAESLRSTFSLIEPEGGYNMYFRENLLCY